MGGGCEEWNHGRRGGCQRGWRVETCCLAEPEDGAVAANSRCLDESKCRTVEEEQSQKEKLRLRRKIEVFLVFTF